MQVVIATRSPEKYDRMRHSLPDNCRARLTAIEVSMYTDHGRVVTGHLFLDIAKLQLGSLEFH